MSPHLSKGYRLAIAVLAAGGSRRFGDADKLTAPFRERMLGLHVPDTLREVEAVHRWVIAATQDHPCASGWRASGFETITNSDAGMGMGTSVALAGQRAMTENADALMICLADMPMVPASNYAGLATAVRESGKDIIIASSDGQTNMPPACFGKEQFAALADSGGDTGARKLLKSARAIICPPEWLIDIDTPETLAELAQRYPD